MGNSAHLNPQIFPPLFYSKTTWPKTDFKTILEHMAQMSCRAFVRPPKRQPTLPSSMWGLEGLEFTTMPLNGPPSFQKRCSAVRLLLNAPIQPSRRTRHCLIRNPNPETIFSYLQHIGGHNSALIWATELSFGAKRSAHRYESNGGIESYSIDGATKRASKY